MAAPSTYMATDGNGHELQMGRWSQRLAQPFLDFAGVNDGELILDAGCGTGSLTFAVLDRANIRGVVGLDYSKAYIDHASSRNDDPRVEFRTGNVCALPFAAATFDRAFSLLVLHFVPQADLAVEEMRRVVRPGGVVAAAVWDLRGGQVANRIFFDTAAMLDPDANERRARNYTRPMARPGELVGAWRKAGLLDVQETTLAIRMEFANFDDYWTPYTGSDGPIAEYVRTLSPERRNKLCDAVRLAYLDGDPDGGRSYSATAWAVRGIAPS